MVLSSCASSRVHVPSRPKRFFACTRWIDRNKDGIYDYYEFENIKTAFRQSDPVMFVGLFDFAPIGTNITFSLFTPDGSLFNTYSKMQVFRGTLLHFEFSASDLVSAGSTGIWSGVWEIEGEVVAVTSINILRHDHY